MRIALVEDNASVAAAVVVALSTCGHEADWLSRGADVLERHAAFDAILLDLGLPDRDGLEVLSDIRAVSTVPVVVLTARGDENSVVLTADVVGPRRRTSVIHGAPGIGSVVLGGAPGSAATLLIGEDLATGDPVADVGWTTGELVELAGRAGGGPRWRGFVDALHRGYLGEDRVWSPEENRRVEQYAGLRILLHLHDFLAYARYSEAEVRLCTSMASSLLDHAVGDREAIA